MKYLKKFNENKSNFDYDSLLEFCEESLVNLTDEGYDITITGWDSNYKIYIVKSEINGYFYWDDVKDDFVQFYELLKDKYSLFDYYNDIFNPCYVELVELGLHGRRSELDFYDKDVDYDYEPTNEKLSSIQIIVDCNNNKK